MVESNEILTDIYRSKNPHINMDLFEDITTRKYEVNEGTADAKTSVQSKDL